MTATPDESPSAYRGGFLPGETRDQREQRMLALDTRIHAWMLAYVRERRYPPTLQEMAEQFGLANRQHAAQRLVAMEQRGWIQKDPGRRRIRVLDIVPEPTS